MCEKHLNERFDNAVERNIYINHSKTYTSPECCRRNRPTNENSFSLPIHTITFLCGFKFNTWNWNGYQLPIGPNVFKTQLKQGC